MLTFIFQVELRELLQLCSKQEKTDTRVALYLHHAVNLGCRNINLAICLDTGSRKHCKLINLSHLAASLGESYCENLLGFYVFTE